MKLKSLFFFAFCIMVSCDNEPVGSSTDNNNSGNIDNFMPSAGYWIYDVSNNIENDPEMNFTATDSIYVYEEFDDYFSLSANDDGLANGSMNMILTNGNLYNSTRKLTFDGVISLPENIAALGLDDFTLNNVTLLDLDVENGEVMFLQEELISNTLNIQETEIPIDLNYEIKTSKIDFHNSININGIEYLNVFEGKFTFSLSVTGTFSIFGFTQTVSIIEPQDIIYTTYHYAESTGLVRAESSQGFELSSELSTILDLLGIPIGFPTSFGSENIEQLIEFNLN